MSITTKHWIVGIIRALSTGSTAGGTSVAYDFLTDHGIDWKRMLMVIIVPAAMRMGGYLKRHPFPGLDIPDDGTAVVQISQPVILVPVDPDKTPTQKTN